MAVPAAAAAVSSTAWDCRPPTGSGTCPSPAGRTRSASSTSWHQVRQTSELLYRVIIVVRHYVYRVVNQVNVMLTSNSELPFSIRWGGFVLMSTTWWKKKKKHPYGPSCNCLWFGCSSVCPILLGLVKIGQRRHSKCAKWQNFQIKVMEI